MKRSNKWRGSKPTKPLAAAAAAAAADRKRTQTHHTKLTRGYSDVYIHQHDSQHSPYIKNAGYYYHVLYRLHKWFMTTGERKIVARRAPV